MSSILGNVHYMYSIQNLGKEQSHIMQSITRQKVEAKYYNFGLLKCILEWHKEQTEV